MSATASSLHSIECSDQPLDLSFHPQRDTLVAAALVDGTVEVHDFQSVIADKDDKDDDDDDDEDDEDEDDTIVSSNHIHKQLIPNPAAAASNNNRLSSNNRNKNIINKKKKSSSSSSSDYGNSSKYAFKKASCRTVHFSNNNGHRLYTGGSAGDLCCLDSELICSFRIPPTTSDHDGLAAENNPPVVVWRIESASVGSSSSTNNNNNNNNNNLPNNPLHVLHQLPACSSKGALIVSGDDKGGVRLWDERLCDVAVVSAAGSADHQQKQRSSSGGGGGGGPLQLPRGCVLSWKEHKDYISALDHSEDGNTLLATSADGCLSVFDIRNASTTRTVQNPAMVKKSDPQDDELLSLVGSMKNGKKVIVGTQDGVLDIWSWGTWGDISDRYPLLQNSHSSLDAILKVDEDTLLVGSSDGLVRVVTLHPNKVLGALGGDHDGFPIETLEFNANRSYVGSISHDPYIRLWDTRILNDDDDDDDEDDEDEADEMNEGEDSKPKAAASVAAKENAKIMKFSVAKGGQASDDEWDDMDDEGDDVDDDNDDEEDKDSDDSDDDSDDDDDDDDEKRPSKSDNRASKLKSRNEDFFADL